MSVYPISNSSTPNDMWARHDVFGNEDIVRLIASFLDRAQDRISFGLINHRMWSILIDPLALPLLPGSIPPWRRNPSSELRDIRFSVVVPIAFLRNEPSSQPPRLTSAVISTNSIALSVLRSATSFLGNTIFDIPYMMRGERHSIPAENRRPPNGNSDESGPNSTAGESLPNYTDVVASINDLKHRTAFENNTDGEKYLKSVIDEYMQTLSDNEIVKFKKKIEEIDEELFTLIPHLAVKKAISSTVPLTRKDTPLFMHAHLGQLEQLRQKQKSLTTADLKKESGIIATDLQRETDCIASMQRALQSFS